MEFGLFTEFESPAGMSQASAFDESLAQMKAAEDLGLDAVWLAEIHFQKGRSVLSSTLIVAAPLAPCTRRIKIGIAVQGAAAQPPAAPGRGRVNGRSPLEGTARVRYRP